MYNVKGNKNSCHPLFPLRKNCHLLPVKTLKCHQPFMRSHLFPLHQNPCECQKWKSTRRERKFQLESLFFWACTHEPKFTPTRFWKTDWVDESRWPSNVCSPAARPLPSSGIWKPWRYYFNESHMCAQYLRQCHIADSFLKSLEQSLKLKCTILKLKLIF